MILESKYTLQTPKQIESQRTSNIFAKPIKHLTFDIAEKYARETPQEKWIVHKNKKKRVTNYPPLSPVVFTEFKEKEELPIHKYFTWDQINKLYNRYQKT